MTERTEANGKEAFWAVEGEIEALLKRHGLAGVVLLTDGNHGRVSRFCDATWNTIFIDDEKNMSAKIGPDPELTKGTLKTFSVLGQMAQGIAVEMMGNCRRMVEQVKGAERDLNDQEDGSGPEEARARRCRGCGIGEDRPGQIGPDNLCINCREKQ